MSANQTFGDVYKWTDEEGKIHYGDKPPTGDPIERIEVKKPPPVYDEELEQERREKLKKLLEVYEEEREEKRVQREAEKEKWRERIKHCEEIRKELNYQETMLGRGNVVVYEQDEEGNPVEVDREKWAEQIEELRQEVKKCCDKRYISCA